jgi:hypothetical protein
MPFAAAIVVAGSPSPLPVSDAPRSPYPRRRRKLVAAGPNVASSAFYRRRLPDAWRKAPLRLGVPAESVRVASDPHRASEATRRHEYSLPSTPAEANVARRGACTPDEADRRRRLEPRKALTGSQRPRTRGAIRAVRALTPTERVADVATGNDPTPPLDGDRVSRKRVASAPCATPRSTLRRRFDVGQRGAWDDLRSAPPEDEARLEEPVPTAEIRPSLRNPRSAGWLLTGVSSRCRHRPKHFGAEPETIGSAPSCGPSPTTSARD